jgi:hypothetical protein
MKRKQQFLRAVRILAPNDASILRAAQFVREASLPLYPGGAALEFVVAIQRLLEPLRPGGTAFLVDAARHSRRLPPAAEGDRCQTQVADDPTIQLSMEDRLRVKSAEYWLKLGDHTQALKELGELPEPLKKHPWVIRVHVSALGAARQLSESRAHAE